MKRFLIILFTILGFGLFTQQTFAHEGHDHSEDNQVALPTPVSPEGWYVSSFDSNIKIQEDGAVNIIETITIDFKDLDKHGILRNIPIIYQGENGQEIYTELNVNSITQDNKKAKFDSYRNGNYIELKIGDADKTISGLHTYKIDYTAKGILKGFSEYDELYWNVTGNEWPIPILETTAKVILPKDGELMFKCVEGITGSTANCHTEQINAHEVIFTSSRSYGASEGMTIVAGYDKGMVPILTVERPKTTFEKFISPQSLITALVAIIFGIGTVFIVWWKHGRDFYFSKQKLLNPDAKESKKPIGAYEPIIVEYTPPENLRPAEIGVLVDERADTLDVSATIIDLASRGYLTITEIPKKWMFGNVDYNLKRTKKDTKDLLSYEKELLTRIFAKGDTEHSVLLSNLKKKFYTDLAHVKKMLYTQVVKQNFFPQDPEKIRGKYIGLGIVTAILGSIATYTSANAGIILGMDLGIGLIVSAVVLFIFARFMPRRTAHGRELYRRVKGYELFISNVEKYKQQFFENKNLFNEVLPYAMIFGLTDKFAKAMHDMGIEPKQPTWYSGSRPYNTAVFASNISSFSNSMSSAIASAPSSSGFSGGGGSSGGGFGGGGGGSW